MNSTIPMHSSSSVTPLAVATLLPPITGSWSSLAIFLEDYAEGGTSTYKGFNSYSSICEGIPDNGVNPNKAHFSGTDEGFV